MCEGPQILMPQALGLKEGDGDAGTSAWSSPDLEDQADSLTDTSGRKKGPQRHKTNHTANSQVLRLPPIKPLQVSKPGIQSANCVRELSSRVWDLQEQLSKARTENKLLKRVQHRHTVALQHFQDSEDGLSQILTKHSNETRVLQGLLCETRACRDNLAKQLQTTENKMLSTKASLRHLQLLSQDQSLLEKEELTFRLNRASAQLEDKDKRILDLEKHLELCQASFNRQIVTEQRKLKEARKTSCYLHEQIYQLNEELQDRERKLETYNIYSHRFLNGSPSKGSESKMVQTDGDVPLHTEAESLFEFEYTETEERLEEQESSVNRCDSPEQQSLVIENPETELSASVPSEENHQEDTETRADAGEHSSSEENPEYQTEGECAEEKEAPQVLEEERRTDEHENEMSYILKKPLKTTEPKGSKLPKIRRSYAFKQSIENLHSGRPAYSSVEEPDQGGDPQQWDS